MSTPKEPNFFSGEEEYARGIDWYVSLFEAAPPCPPSLCGESSTHYTKLPLYPDTVNRMRQHLPPHTRFIYIMRHPIDRLVSQYIHGWTQRTISCSIDQAIDEHPQLIQYGRYSMQLEPYLEAFGPARVLPVFFDRLSVKPQSELERVCRFIGYGGTPHWNESVSRVNASSERLRKSALRDVMINLPGIKSLRRKLVPQLVRDRVKSLWTMKQRPELSPASVHRLRRIFDDDLAILGRWLGLNLNCETFKHATVASVPQWRDAGKVGAA
jgi:hypothetical protein